MEALQKTECLQKEVRLEPEPIGYSPVLCTKTLNNVMIYALTKHDFLY